MRLSLLRATQAKPELWAAPQALRYDKDSATQLKDFP